jgi:hypothetical protein
MASAPLEVEAQWDWASLKIPALWLPVVANTLRRPLSLSAVGGKDNRQESRLAV